MKADVTTILVLIGLGVCCTNVLHALAVSCILVAAYVVGQAVLE
jgi:hypothetical protein